MRSDLLAKRLQDKGVGNIGTDIFLHFMPVECSKGVLVKEPLHGMILNNELPGFIKTNFQIIVRAGNQVEGQDLVDRVSAAMKIKNELTLVESGSGEFAMKIIQCLPSNLPIRFPRLDGNEIEWSLNYHISFVIPEP